MPKERRRNIYLTLTYITFYAVGVVSFGFNIFRDEIVKGSSLLLFMSLLGLIFTYSDYKNTKRLLFILFAFVIGMTAEILGVQYNLIFGYYKYSDILGPKILGVPLIIGSNWVLLTLCSMSIIEKYKIHWLIKSAIVALMLVFVDFLIEPVAVHLNFWQWEQGATVFAAPWSNFMGWFFVSLFINMIGYLFFNFERKNSMSQPIFVTLILFFSLLNILL